MPVRESWTLGACTDPWPDIVQRLALFLRVHALDARNTLVLLPFAQHLPLARQAWARLCGGWMPRFETTQTLRESLPAPALGALGPSGDPVADRLAAARLLTDQAWAAPARRRDPALFEHWVRGVVEMSHQMMRAAFARQPGERAAFWSEARAVLPAPGGPGGMEAVLARVALEWAAVHEAGPADELFRLQPAGWAVVEAGEPEGLTSALLAASEAPQLRIHTDPDLATPFAAAAPDLQILACADFEEEAQAAAAQVLSHLQQGQAPVAVMAQDRVLVRRLRALLERRDVLLRDETGWRLSTTRAGAAVAGVLALAGPKSGTDELLDWLKSSFVGVSGETGGRAAEQALETALRRQQWAALHDIDSQRLSPVAEALWQAVQRALAPLQGEPRRASVLSWNQRLREALQAAAAWDALQADEAGQQVIEALRLDSGAPAVDAAFARQAEVTLMDLGDYAAWVDSLLETGVFAPPATEDAEVVITPLARAMLRPFAACVMPGCDEQRLGPVAASVWLGERERLALGLPTRAAAMRLQTVAFAHLARQPRVTLLWRNSQDGEPLGASVLVERLQLERRRAALLEAEPQDPRCERRVVAQPVHPSAPRAPALVPERLSATSYEALRDCPYRFFALRMLGLGEAAELDDEVERRDYGTWLHAVLQDFHEQRSRSPLDAEGEVARLVRLGAEQQGKLGLDEAAFLPFALRFGRVAQLYVDWMLAHEAGGAEVLKSEVTLSAPLPQRPATRLHGTLDRVDIVHGPDGPRTLILDYKTGSLEALKRRQRDPLEDTQLAFYAALLRHGEAAPGSQHGVRALYLAMEGREIEAAEHPEVEATAEVLLQGLADDIGRLADGATLPPLGEGSACEHCDARGLCRKAHWAEPLLPDPATAPGSKAGEEAG
ncbi:PD-(D/E)XK nuclease family protein [Aquabacterium sp. A7-Y]|uniref:PD-(D/E)XK nuclease family protein n=1 Tax=Aquabacterium sp. A7-Y TaxID=1349605 RepID=UPI00223CDC60|nr:PD-(D/E)XK nuclease family protein [Aquabacterium sp. A7-Y]MCW7540801.1 PD-(D/E)XK nuclease family protein [Aquabacterium sp. A7-Y]